ncbi:hypothetical protein GBA52_003959 [Prunus armeniaca]|nr:hypothetical protein GBA52_003959 [Prunus armeniaca]
MRKLNGVISRNGLRRPVGVKKNLKRGTDRAKGIIVGKLKFYLRSCVVSRKIGIRIFIRNWGSAINCIEKVVTLQMNLELIQPVLLKKVKKAAFEMGSLKAPGPNGFQAYDRVERDFLEEVMRRMGFVERWISLVVGCVKSIAFAIIKNGQSERRFKPLRGIRQGDLISPYLFLFVSDVFSQMISKAVDSNVLQGIKFGHKAHIIFADDTWVFLKATNPCCDQLVKSS